jgi:hypothetical protein
MKNLLKYSALVRRITAVLSFMVVRFRLIVRWLSCMTPFVARWSLVLLMG